LVVRPIDGGALKLHTPSTEPLFVNAYELGVLHSNTFVGNRLS